jgi:dinuclear metal center YbgI/SA1388 family protein
MIARDDLAKYLDEMLRIEAIEDTSNNGLQVEGAAEIGRLAFAVDAGLAAFDGARAAGAQMLVVHHGLFWSKPVMVTGPHRHRLSVLLEADVSLYAVHLPLDFHPEVGNNVTLARWLGLSEVETFGQYKGQPAGYAGRLPEPLSLDDLAARVEETLGEQVTQVWPFGKSRVETVGIISGGAARFVDQVAAAGVDVFLTGETSHGSFHDAKELGINVIFGGHYATETAGLKALAEHLAAKFGLETLFLDLPTGA